LQEASSQLGAELSPDGRYVAYVSDESGRDEIYVLPFPQGAAAARPSRTTLAGKRFPLAEPVGAETEQPAIRIVLNWHEEFRDHKKD